jgi:hypothetical protein
MNLQRPLKILARPFTNYDAPTLLFIKVKFGLKCARAVVKLHLRRAKTTVFFRAYFCSTYFAPLIIFGPQQNRY